MYVSAVLTAGARGLTVGADAISRGALAGALLGGAEARPERGCATDLPIDAQRQIEQPRPKLDLAPEARSSEAIAGAFGGSASAGRGGVGADMPLDAPDAGVFVKPKLDLAPEARSSEAIAGAFGGSASAGRGGVGADMPLDAPQASSDAFPVGGYGASSDTGSPDSAVGSPAWLQVRY
jgi:hypothetical protein